MEVTYELSCHPISHLSPDGRILSLEQIIQKQGMVFKKL